MKQWSDKKHNECYMHIQYTSQKYAINITVVQLYCMCYIFAKYVCYILNTSNIELQKGERQVNTRTQILWIHGSTDPYKFCASFCAQKNRNMVLLHTHALTLSFPGMAITIVKQVFRVLPSGGKGLFNVSLCHDQNIHIYISARVYNNFKYIHLAHLSVCFVEKKMNPLTNL